MLKFSGIFLLWLFSIPAIGQIKGTIDLPPVNGDTVYIGVENKIKLNPKTVKAISAESSDARVSINANVLTVVPVNKPGEIVITIIYKDSTISRKYYATYLPKPHLSRRLSH
jgi:hypothetical protein